MWTVIPALSIFFWRFIQISRVRSTVCKHAAVVYWRTVVAKALTQCCYVEGLDDHQYILLTLLLRRPLLWGNPLTTVNTHVMSCSSLAFPLPSKNGTRNVRLGPVRRKTNQTALVSATHCDRRKTDVAQPLFRAIKETSTAIKLVCVNYYSELCSYVQYSLKISG